MSEANAADKPTVLAFENVSIEAPQGFDHGLRGANFLLKAGDCCLVRLEWESLR